MNRPKKRGVFTEKFSPPWTSIKKLNTFEIANTLFRVLFYTFNSDVPRLFSDLLRGTYSKAICVIIYFEHRGCRTFGLFAVIIFQIQLRRTKNLQKQKSHLTI